MLRLTASRVLSLALASSILVACGGKPPAKAAPAQAGVSDACPDLSRPDEVSTFDFAGAYALSAVAADKLKAATLAAIELAALGERLDADFGIACAQIAHDLGDKSAFRTGNDACAAAVKAVQEARGRLGPKAQTELVVRRPVCLVDASLMTKCASICDSSVPADRIGAECEQRAGRCDGDCDGTCEPKGGSKCGGVCTGTCEGAMTGTCGGRCVGTCDGKRVNGGCLGVCVGTCDRGAMTGDCKGACYGSCKLAGPGICDGTCAGTCSVDLADARCSGGFKQPEVSTDCRARCDLAILNKTECSRPEVGFVVVGAKDRDAAEAMKVAVDKAFPELLEILYELGDGGAKQVMNAQAVIEGARTGLGDMARSGGAAEASEARLASCFDAPFKKAAADAATIKAGIDAARAIRDEAAGVTSPR